MINKHWVSFTLFGFFIIIALGIFFQAIKFNNQMISLRELKNAEIEATKVEYGQCVIKVLEANKIADLYRDDVLHLTTQAGDNLHQFNKQLFALIGTQIIPKLTHKLRENVQREIFTCRNAYTGRVDYALKPLFVNFNRLQLQFPNNLYNSLFFHWQPQPLIVPKNEAGEAIFASGKIKQLDLQ